MRKTRTRTSGKTRIAVAGLGGRGVWAAETMLKDPNYTLVALCDPLTDRMEVFKRNNGLAGLCTYPSIIECLKHENIDAVAVNTSDSHHAEVAIPALEAGKFVYMEKPLEITEEQCRAILKADQKAGGKTFMGFNLRFAPVYVTIKKLIDEGAIGRVLTLQTDEFYDGGRTYFRRWNRLRKHGGGLWITKTCHDFDLLYWMAGKNPLSVYATDALSYYQPRKDAALFCSDCSKKYTCFDSSYMYWASGKPLKKRTAPGKPVNDLCLFNSDKDTFDHGAATIQFEDGIIASHTCNVVAGFSNRRMRVSGTKGTIDGSLESHDIILQRRDPPSTRIIRLKGSLDMHGGGDKFILKDFYKFTKGLVRPKLTVREAMIPVLMGIAANRSVDEKRRVEMSEFKK